MFEIGDLIIYSAHGICKIEDICERTVSGGTRSYYVLHPMENYPQVTIHTPVNNDKVVMLSLLKKGEANEILESFKGPGAEWIEQPNKRNTSYSKLVNTGDRKQIANVVNVLMRKEIEDSKLYVQDRKLLIRAQRMLFKELSLSLEKPHEEISELISSFLKEHQLEKAVNI